MHAYNVMNNPWILQQVVTEMQVAKVHRKDFLKAEKFVKSIDDII